MDTPLGEVEISGGYEIVMEAQKRCNAYESVVAQRDVAVDVCKTWLEAVQNSLSLRLTLTGLPEGAGPVLVEILQEAIGKGEETA